MKGLLKNDKFTFSIICALALAIGAFGICAKGILADCGGFAAGLACSILLFATLAVFYSASSPEVRTRTKDMFFMSIAMIGLYLILFFVTDIAMVYNVGMAICTSVFMAFFVVGCAIALTKLVLELCGIKWEGYEKALDGRLCAELKEKCQAQKAKKAKKGEDEGATEEQTSEVVEETETQPAPVEVDDTPVSPLVVEEEIEEVDDTIIAEDPAFATPVVDEPVIEPITEKDRRADDEVAEELSSSLFDEEEQEAEPIISEADGTVVISEVPEEVEENEETEIDPFEEE
ncbi:MAG: hypothetical protein IKC60_03680 [Clostridia bacterium]|nr:hypothetical protein [Clostridia bacterium]